MVETVIESTLNDLTRGVLLTVFLLGVSISVSYGFRAIRAFHARGMARVRAYESSGRTPITPTNCRVVAEPQRRLRAVS